VIAPQYELTIVRWNVDLQIPMHEDLIVEASEERGVTTTNFGKYGLSANQQTIRREEDVFVLLVMYVPIRNGPDPHAVHAIGVALRVNHDVS
tara:strand:- start:12416 stop:12691 length:276 start_codon:yes stop_codon:yes gene_type:complete